MNVFYRTHLNNIKRIFEEKTGVTVTARKAVRPPVRTLAILAAAIACIAATTAFAASLFSSLSGDDLGLSATYEGDGIVSVHVENRSDKELRFEPVLKLMQWSTGEEVPALQGDVSFSGTDIPAHSDGTMTIDLSEAYDMALLEVPLSDKDWYYLILTNNRFAFGQDWMCTVIFAEPIHTGVETPAPVAPAQADPELIAGIEEELRTYFETYTTNPDERNQLAEEYLALCQQLLSQTEGTVVPAVSPMALTVREPGEPVVFDPAVPPDMQLQLAGIHCRTTDGYDKKIGASDSEGALVISAYVPQCQGQIDGGAAIPLIYVFTYEADATHNSDNYAFIRGRLLTFEEMEIYKIYEDGQYVCYDVSGLFYSDLRRYVESMVSQRSDVYFDEQIWERVQNLCTYYRENLGTLLERRDTAGGGQSVRED